jgi:hypothetical protein
MLSSGDGDWNSSVRLRDSGSGNVSGPRSNPKGTPGGAFLKFHLMQAQRKFVAAILIKFDKPIPIGS